MRQDSIAVTRSLLVAVLAVALAGVEACENDGPRVELPTFRAELSGANEVPPVDTEASGLATFTVRGTIVDFEITVTNTEDAVAAHIHSGSATVNGPVVVTLFTADPPVTIQGGVLAEGQFTATDVVGMTLEALLDLLRTGGAYVNVHTTAHPGGEIRGQIEAQG